jgi:YjjG family noncanonical pyrimidine nucleotidase
VERAAVNLRYKHIFFDLDRTLWDLRTNASRTLLDLYEEFALHDLGIAPSHEFVLCFEEVNERLWTSAQGGGMPKETLRVLRFRQVLRAFGVHNDGLARRLGHAFAQRCPQHTTLMPGAKEVLDAWFGQASMHIITNGWTDAQHQKLVNSGIRWAFKVVLTSEQAGCAKPNVGIFERALELAGALPNESVMVGDSAKADIDGARSVGMDQAWLRTEGQIPPDKSTYTVNDLRELLTLFRA